MIKKRTGKQIVNNVKVICSSIVMLLAIKVNPEKEYLEEIVEVAETAIKIHLWELLFNEHFPVMDWNDEE